MIAFVEDRLPADATAVPLARHQLALALLTDVSETTLDTVLLLANEAVSSALTNLDSRPAPAESVRQSTT